MELPLLLHPVTAEAKTKQTASAPSKWGSLPRRAGMAKRRMQASAPPPSFQRMPGRVGTASAAVVAAVVEMVSVAEPPALVTVAGLVEPKLSVGGSCAPLGLAVIAAESATLPVNPPAGAMAMLSVPLLPLAIETEDEDGVSVKPAGAVTVSAMVVVAVKLPEVPVTVTLLGPGVAALVAVKVTTLDDVAGFVAKLAVTPVGSPVAARVTLPMKPLAPATVTVSVALPPAASESAGETAARVKLGATTVKLCATSGAAA